MNNKRWTYAAAGVDIKRIKGSQKDISEILKETVTNREGKIGTVLEDIGHYAGLIDLGKSSALALHTDGVGTKVLVAQMMNKFDTIGIDCVAMNVNDIICLAAEPIAFIDYIALKKLDKDLIKQISKGLVLGAKEASVAIVGGETAIMPDVIDGKDNKTFDLVGMVVGIVNKKQVITGNQIKKGDIIIGAESSGIHSNGYSLVRKVLLSKYGIRENVGLDGNLGEELLKPTKIYVKPILEILQKLKPSGLAHITGGGFSKLTRLVKARNLGFRIDNMPKPLPIFTLIQDEGKISNLEMYRTFNMGIGFCIIASPVEAEKIQKILRKHSINSTKIGEIVKDPGVFIAGLKID